MVNRISDHTRKRLWTKAGDSCAFTGCGESLLHPNEAGSEETIVGVECHIVAKRDHPSVARSPSSLSDEESMRWASLIERRHELPNLVLMCQKHARVIDDPAQGYNVAQVVEMKHLHEEEVSQRHRMPLPDGTARERSTTVRQAVLLEDVPAWQRKALAALAKVDPDALLWLQEQIGSSAEAEKVGELISRWPDKLQDGPRELATLLVREAEALAMWEYAAQAWEQIAADTEGAERADLLARAAVDAGVGDHGALRERLLEEAETLDPSCVRARLERFDDSVGGSARLAFLTELRSEDPALASLIACHRALAHLQVSDLDAAEHAIAEAERLDADSIGVRIAQINLGLQRARVAVAEDRPFMVARLLDSYDQALEQRESLVAMARWKESVRLLMMAADARSLLRDGESARAVLEQARPEEIEAEEGAAVLGDAALRAGAPELALLFVEGIEPDDGLKRIAASARAEIGGAGRARGLIELEEIALGGGPEAEASAVARLILCMPPVCAAWSEPVADVLQSPEHEHYVAPMRILSMASHDVRRAQELAAELPREAWAAEVRLRIASVAGKKPEMAIAAKEFLGFSPDGSGRLLAARALAQSGEIERAGDTASGVARDLNCPPRVRSDAFHVAMKTLADRDEWQLAERLWEEWRDFAFRELTTIEGRVSAWQVRVMHHKRRSGSG